ncbi:MAG: glutamate 5-kinase [Gaiellaceae bacterium]|nr:glutamate 5-kinase [Gaiellaceae bacterium]
MVKFGSALVADGRGRVRRELLRARAAEIAELVGAGTPVCVVSSGAIALGLPLMGLSERPRALPRMQAASALGQSRLQRAWEEVFARNGIRAAQVLLTGSEIADRRAYVNARGALDALFALGAVPVVNENDATATDEISFGDNDSLAAQVAVLVGARLLVLLTSVEGVHTHAPGTPGATLISEGSAARGAAFGAGSALGRGGMESKVRAAELAAAAGIPTVIAGGAGGSVLGPLLAGEARGTRFAAAPGSDSASAYKLWLRFGKRIAARLVVDEGAKRAVVGGASLLAVGVVGWEPDFRAGDGVEIVGADGVPFARGISAVDAGELAGRPPNVEAVHRDRLVLVQGTP